MAIKLFWASGHMFGFSVWLVGHLGFFFYNKVLVTGEVLQKTTLCSKMAVHI